MGRLRRERYWCVNPACAIALSDRVFSRASFRRYSGCCPANAGGCGQILRRGEDRDLLPHVLGIALLGAALGGIGVLAAPHVRDAYWPPPPHVRFAQPHSEVADGGRVLDIEVRRDVRLGDAIDIDYVTQDDTATAGADYIAVRGRLRFAPGQWRRHIPVTVLSDASHQKPPRHFSLQLISVAGSPSHRIAIVPPSPAPADRTSAEGLALSASRIAKDIADLRLKQHIADELMNASRSDPGAYATYRSRLASASGDLSRARERYLQELEQLGRLPPAAVLDAVDAIAARFVREGFAQQADAARVMKRHLRERLDGRPPEMDRWAQELMDVIPRIDKPPRKPTTT